MITLFFFFLGLKICTNVKNKYEKRIFNQLFLKKKIIHQICKKLKIMLQHFLIGFGLIKK
jgi:hypothetical protein